MKNFIRFLFVLAFVSVTATLPISAIVRYVKPVASSTAWGTNTPLYTDLNAAITAAASGDEIWVAAGTYKPTTGVNRSISFSLKNGVKLLGGFAGTETSSTSRNWNANKTILSGDIGVAGTTTDNSYHVVSAIGTSLVPFNASTLLDGFVIEQGYSADYGGGVFCLYASLVVQNCLIRNNNTNWYGGGIYGYYGSPSILNCIITQNKSGYGGGGVCADSYSTFNLVNTTVSNNTSQYGGGFYSWGGTFTGVNLISWGNIPAGIDGTYTYSCIEGGSGTGVTTKNPLFIDAAAGDFRLNAKSPCINKGSNAALPSSITSDLMQNARIQGDTIDMGAIEGGITTPVIVSPVNNATVKGLVAGNTVSFSWKWASGNAPAGVTGYQLQYWTAKGDTTKIDLTELNKEVILPTGVKYYWRVGSSDGSLLINWSNIQIITISHATPFYVKQGATGDGSSWTSAYGKLQDALKVAIYGDEIWVAAGTYKPANVINRDSTFTIPNGVKVLGGFAGNETASSARNWNTNKTILSGDVGVAGTATDNSYHVVSIVGTSALPIDSTTILDGFIIEKGYAYGYYGGGIYCRYSSPEIQNCLIQSNYSSYYGGGVYGYSGSPTIVNSIISKNSSGTNGAALCADSYSNFKILNSTITANSSGVYSWGGSISGTNNIIFGNNSGNSGTYSYSCIEGGSGTGVINKDPQFIDAAAGDFRLNAQSPCINKGRTAALLPGSLVDFALNTRIQNDTVDMGALEGGVTTPIIVLPVNNATVKGLATGNTVSFSWKWASGTVPAGVTGYQLQYWIAKGDTTNIDLTEFKKDITLPDGNKYYWRVGSLDGSLLIKWSTIQTINITHSAPLYVKQGATGDGSSWTSAYGKLQDALKAAIYSDEIWVAAGTYKPANGTNRDSTFSIPNGIKVLGGFAGKETASSVRNWITNKTILSGDIGVAGTATDNSYHVVSIIGTSALLIDSTTILDGFIIEKGYCNNNYSGGGIYCLYSSPVIQNCLIQNNYSPNSGGGVYGYYGNPTIVNSIIFKNSAVSNGAALCASNNTNFKILNSTITANSSGINSWGGSITGTNNIIFGNNSANSGTYTYSCIEGGSGTGVINKDPQFIDAAAGDLRLNAQSPCLNKGLNAALLPGSLLDFALNARIQKDTVDMGAIEGSVVTPVSISPVNKAVVKGLQEGNLIPFSCKWASGTAPAGVTGYKLQYWTAKGDTTKIDLTELNKDIALPSGVKYYWRVGSTDGSSFSNWSTIQTISITHAAPLHVKQGAIGDGSSWNSAYGKLQDALSVSVNGDEVWVAAGTYKPANGTNRDSTFNVGNGVNLLGGFDGTETSSVARNWNKNKTILSGDVGAIGTKTDNSYHVISLIGTLTLPIDSTTRIDGFIIENGYADYNYNDIQAGGGLYCIYASPLIQNCLVHDNYADYSGGGVYSRSGTLKIRNSILTQNSTNYIGGAVYVEGGAAQLSQVTITANASVSSNGGVQANANVTGINSIIWGNSPSSNSGNYTYSCIEGGSGTGVVNKKPLFIDAAAGDFRLNAQSPCVNKGRNAALLPSDTLDFVFNKRIQNDTVDMGAIEGSVVTPVLVSPANASVVKGDDLFWSKEVTFNWRWASGTAPSDVTGYVVQYWKQGGDTTTLKNITQLDTTLILDNSSRYCWRVGSVSSLNTNVSWAPMNQFIINFGRPIYVKSGGSRGNGGSWQYAYNNLQSALNKALTGDEIWMTAGTYKPTAGTNRDSTFTIPNGVKVLGGFSGSESLASSRNWSSRQTILSGDIGVSGTKTDNSYHVVSLIGTSSSPLDNTTVLDGLVIEGGYGASYGGGIYNNYSSSVIKNCVIRDNCVKYYGSGVYGLNSRPTIINSVLYKNSESSFVGGALYADNSTDFSLVNTTLTKNASGLIAGNGYITGANVISWGNTSLRNDGYFTNSCVEGRGSGIEVISKNPMFADTASNNFRLLPKSPCINTGLNTAISTVDSLDMDKQSRIAGTNVDMGAYESMYPVITSPKNNSGTSTQGNMLIYKWTTGSKNEGDNSDPFNSPSTTSTFHVKVWSKGDTSKVTEDGLSNHYVYMSPSFSFASAYQWQVGTVVNGYTYWSDTSMFYVGHSHPLYVKTGSTGDGLSWSNAFGSITSAVSEAIPGDEIWVAAGTYTPGTDRGSYFKLKSFISLYGGFAGTEIMRDFKDPAKNVTILSGDIGTAGDASDNCYHIINNLYTASDSLIGATIDGFTLSGGNAGTENGGAMFNQHASPTVYNCIFANNKGANGAAIANVNASSPYIYNSLFYGNTATTAGGAIFSDATSTPTLLSSTLTGNAATKGAGISGGGIVGNSIIYGNGTNEVDGNPSATYSCIKGGYKGDGNVSGSPDFKDVTKNDYRLSAFSSCYNKGSDKLLPADKFADLWQHEQRSFLGKTDIGAYELTYNEIGSITIDSISPAHNATVTNITNPVVVYFNKPISRSDLTKLKISPAVELTNSILSRDSTCLTLSYKSPWAFNQKYALTFAASSITYIDNELIGMRDTTFNFIIRGCIPAQLLLEKAGTVYCPDVSASLKTDTITGDANKDYAWYFNDNKLSTFDGMITMKIDSVNEKSVGSYKCTVSDMCGTVAKDSVVVSYKTNVVYPVIVKKWTDVLLVDNNSGIFSNYSWKQNGYDQFVTQQYIKINSSYSGLYEVKALDSISNCMVHSTYNFIATKAKLLKVYPSPVHVAGLVTIDFGEKKSGTLRLIDLKGVQVYEGEFNADSQYEFRNTNFAPGVYVLEIISDGERSTTKLIIEK